MAITLGLVAITPALATSLPEVYQDALKNDPTFKTAQATWQADRENLYIARAGVLPQLVLTAHTERVRIRAEGLGGGVSYSSPYGYGLSIQQPLFNLNAWMTISEAAADVKRAYAQYAAAAEDLLLRTATAYFSVLEAHDVLTFTRLEKKAVGQDLDQSEQRYKAGLTAITAFYDAQARYDAITANEISAANELSNRIEALHEITGRYYESLCGLSNKITTALPNPTDINQWVNAAEKQNYSLKAAHFATLAARENIRANQTTRLPTLTATGSLNVERGGNPNTVISTGIKAATIGLSANFPVYQGGLVSASTRQANFNYQRASSETERIHRQVVSLTRQAYLGIVSGVSKIKADKQVIVSRQSALEGREAGYKVGTRTMVDLLDSQADLYGAKINYASDLYRYFINSLNLKQSAGTLSPNDLTALNHWLTKPTPLPSQSG